MTSNTAPTNRILAETSEKSILSAKDGVVIDNENIYLQNKKPYIEGKSLKIKLDFSFMDSDYDTQMQLLQKNISKPVIFKSKNETRVFKNYPIIYPKMQFSLMGSHSGQKTKGNIVAFMYRWTFRITAPFFQIAAHNILKAGSLVSMIRFINIKQSSRINAFTLRLRINALGFLPKFYKFNESEVDCTPQRKFHIHNYSCMITNNISHIFVAMLILLILKVIIFIPYFLLREGKAKYVFKKMNEFFGVMTFFYFISAFENELLLGSLIDGHNTVADQWGQLFGKMIGIATISLVFYVIIKLGTKSTDIMINAVVEKEWLYIKKDIRKDITAFSTPGYYIAEITAIRDIIVVFSFVFLYNNPANKLLISLVAVLVCLIVRCVTFPKVNYIENVVGIITEALISILFFQYWIQVKYDLFGADFFADIVITEAVLIAIVSIFGEIISIIYELVIIGIDLTNRSAVGSAKIVGDDNKKLTENQKVFKQSSRGELNVQTELMGGIELKEV